jgi:peptide/nickel transport system ATP-binding protein
LRAQRIVLQGSVADPANPPPGCYFHPRCQYALDVCKTDTPELEEVEPGHFVACHRARDLTLRGVVGERPVKGAQ